ncbi:MAG: hypothetical protein ACFFDW_01030 [Candidatus Thorarchaeota archaeon]
MNEKNFLMKNALSEEGKYLGKIVEVSKSANSDIIFSIEVPKGRNNEKCSLSLRKYPIKNTDEFGVFFSITKKEYDLLVKQLKAELQQKIKNSKFGKAKDTDKALAYSIHTKI